MPNGTIGPAKRALMQRELDLFTRENVDPRLRGVQPQDTLGERLDRQESYVPTQTVYDRPGEYRARLPDNFFAPGELTPGGGTRGISRPAFEATQESFRDATSGREFDDWLDRILPQPKKAKGKAKER